MNRKDYEVLDFSFCSGANRSLKEYNIALLFIFHYRSVLIFFSKETALYPDDLSPIHLENL